MANAFLTRYSEIENRGNVRQQENVIFTSSSYSSNEQSATYEIENLLDLSNWDKKFSLECYFKITEFNSSTSIVTFGSYSSKNALEFTIYKGKDSDVFESMITLLNQSNMTTRFVVNTQKQSNIFFELNTIYHVVFVYAEDSIKVYLNGQQLQLMYNPSDNNGEIPEIIDKDGSIPINLMGAGIRLATLKLRETNYPSIVDVYECNIYMTPLTEEDIIFNYNRAKGIYS